MTNNGQKMETKFKTVRLFNHWINPSIKVVTIHRIESGDIKELYRGVSDKIYLRIKKGWSVYRNTNMLPSS
jgi:hypothetical protein